MYLSFLHLLYSLHLNSPGAFIVAVIALVLAYRLLGWRVKTLKVSPTCVTVTFQVGLLPDLRGYESVGLRPQIEDIHIAGFIDYEDFIRTYML